MARPVYRKKKKFQSVTRYVSKHKLTTLVLVVLVFGLVFTLGQVKVVHDFFSHANSSLPVPTGVGVVQEDTSAIISWKNYFGVGLQSWFPSEDAHIANNIGGWLVTWGKYDTATNSIINPQKKVWGASMVQLQPLDDNTTYAAQIQTVAYDGSVSDPTPLVTFHTDHTRVNALRQQMNGFFDDFSLPAGAFDETKWNSAYSGCTGPVGTYEGQFINTQFHAHNQTFDLNCDRGENLSRPRGVFDFSPTSARPYGTIVVDFDNALSRDKWYMDIMDAQYGPYDIEARNAASDGDTSDVDGPINDLRIAVDNGVLNVFYTNSTGHQSSALPSSSAVTDKTVYCAKNVRCHWIVQLSPSHVSVTIDGKLMADVSNLNLPFTKAYVNLAQFSYNTAKEEFPTDLIHWDNFGFDAPAGYTPTTVTHNYIDGEIGAVPQGGEPFTYITTSKPATKTIKVPDSIVGNTAQRLMFTLQQPCCQAFGWTPNDYVLFNGVKYSLPDPKTLTRNAAQEPDVYKPIPMILNVTNAQTGDNTVEFHLTSAGVLNVHLELDFSINSAPSYTQPIDIYHFNPIPNAVGDIGNDATITDIGGNAAWQYAAGAVPSTGAYTLYKTLSGSVPIYVDINESSAGNGEGQEYGVKAWQFYVDRQQVLNKWTNAYVPAPSVYGLYTWDTTKVCNGQHELFVQSINGNGSYSIPAYFESFEIKNGAYLPIVVTTNNPGQSACDANLNAKPLPSTLLGVIPTIPMASDMVMPSIIMSPTPTSTTTPSSLSSITIDNVVGTGFSQTGTWTTSTPTGYYGVNEQYDDASGNGKNTATWTPTITIPGTYNVSINYVSNPNRATNVPVTIIDATGTHTKVINQRVGGNGTFLDLGTYTFNAGTSGSVKISNSGTNGYIIADAVRFQLVAAVSTPTPTQPAPTPTLIPPTATPTLLPTPTNIPNQPSPTPSAAPVSVTNPNSRITWQGQQWYLNGVNVPWYNWSCDFGCNAQTGKSGGVSTNISVLSTAFSKLSSDKIHMVRWWVFPGSAWQITQDASGTPTAINPAVYTDFDAALKMADQYDLYYDFVLFSSPTQIPTAWETNATKRVALANVLGTLFAHYAGNKHILSWEIYNEPEADIWNNRIAQTPVVQTGTAIAQSVHKNSPGTLVTVGSLYADGIPMWKNAGLDYYSPHWYDYMNSGTYCIICHSYQYYATQFGIAKPIVVGEYSTEVATTTPYSSTYRLNYWYANGYAGAWAWSLFPNQTSDKLAVDFNAAATFGLAHGDLGPQAPASTSSPNLIQFLGGLPQNVIDILKQYNLWPF